MADPKSRARVERILRGDFRPDDLMGLFLFARDRCDGRESVAEIGHFIAHHQERDKGIVTRSTREWFAAARFHFSSFGPDGHRRIDVNSMPAATRDYLMGAVNRIDAKFILKETGLRRAAAYELIGDISGRLIQNPNGTWMLPKDITKTELNLVKCLSSYLVAKPAFDADQLFDGFIATLKSNGLINSQELTFSRDNLRTLILLYAVAAMHNCIVQIGDGTTTQLKARPDVLNKTITVDAAVPAAVPDRPNVYISCNMFVANLDPAVHCHSDLVLGNDWNFEIELTSDKRLSPLR